VQFNEDIDYSVDRSVVSDNKLPGQNREQPLSITQVNSIVRGLIDDLIPQVWITGEISDLSQPKSGHIYFSIKDKESTIRAVMWQSNARQLKFGLQDGQQVVGFGKLEVYVPRGTYQIVLRSLHPAGEGGLQAALRKLHQKLAAEGLFEETRKKRLPRYPMRIGFVTSPSGAAIKDFNEMLRARWPAANILIIPAAVQGDNAPREIVAGIQAAQRIRPQLDLLVVGRGGGSMEDLWHFNDERVVRAVAKCKLPTISAVGHEIDVTLCDLAADLRALTPSDAAVKAAPAIDEVSATLSQMSELARTIIKQHLQNLEQRLHAFSERPVLIRPEEIFIRRQQVLDELESRLSRSLLQTIKLKEHKLQALQASANALNPLGVLSRGYSITRRADNNGIIRSTNDIESGLRIETLLHDGKIVSEVE
jgi:exodeoxyribonuclease VII large subunit